MAGNLAYGRGISALSGCKAHAAHRERRLEIGSLALRSGWRCRRAPLTVLSDVRQFPDDVLAWSLGVTKESRKYLNVSARPSSGTARYFICTNACQQLRLSQINSSLPRSTSGWSLSARICRARDVRTRADHSLVPGVPTSSQNSDIARTAEVCLPPRDRSCGEEACSWVPVGSSRSCAQLLV